uniref:N-acetyltransferase domain-containing protein n=1 Tax=Pyrodinium bahamense TaxID=73915 RepID=A0A7S0A037_9DINO|mmetsp:Transcript_17206/g.47458  ORF Transcript_17206/g.47458 Transcript_17206/m.47458 type:complete len:295 (+) Transcript_17206:36-920(+)
MGHAGSVEDGVERTVKLGVPDDMAAKLAVPDEDREAFTEFYYALGERLGKAPPEVRLRMWRAELAKNPAQVQVRAFMKRGDVVSKIEAMIGKHGDVTLRALESFRACLMFSCVYGRTRDGKPLPFADALTKVLHDIEAQLSSRRANSAPQHLTCKPGTFSQNHAGIRAAAFPYAPACTTGLGDMTIDCFVEAGDELLGYIAFNEAMGYVDDLSVWPAHQGRGVAKTLVRAAARYLDNAGVPELSLHVRAANYPAIRLYKSLGLEVGDNVYPPWYDWHGGYLFCGSSKQLAEGGG